MQYYIGIVPPDDLKKKIVNFQQQWENNRLVEGVEPHITVKAQGGLTPDMKWLEGVKTECENFLPFEVTISNPKFFGEDILFLSVDSDELTKLHERLVESVSPSKELIKTYFELDEYFPHLTLGQTHFGLTNLELNDMAKKAIKELIPASTFKVEFIRVYKSTEIGYLKFIDIPLMKM
ncbi:2'-5' RNA ligase family protein [Gottfriedia acidiceleris]|uniref:2'-5' RNA ligase family protein n=1 Tax=Gottfriedia acidiceleris TaxID=371036 RepID=UPI0014317B20|nr:2'-5' RNA ligase family protein [Gottfriedia acidiceleris]